MLVRLVLIHLHPHLLNSSSFSQFQSAYMKGHSTETAVLEVLDGVYTAADDKEVVIINYYRPRLVCNICQKSAAKPC